MKSVITCFLAAMLFAIVSGGTTARAASIQLTSTTLAISPGGSAGLGFSFTNDSSGYAVFDFTSLTENLIGYGTYADFIGTQPDLVIVAPGSTMSQSFDKLTGKGAGQYSFLNSTPPGTTVSATLALYYDVYSVDPNSAKFDPFADYLSSKSVSQTVTLVATSVPEPGEWGEAAVGLLLVVLAKRRRR